jgi:hypothetical protein
MRWKLLRRRLSISAPRMIVRSRLPWPLRWVIAALMLGFSAALALWAFEFGKDIAGLDRNATAELARLRSEMGQMRSERETSQSVANTAESLMRAEKSAQEKLTQQLKQVEAENLSLKADLGFYERLLPAGASGGLSVRAFQASTPAPGRLRYQALVMQIGKTLPEFSGRYEVMLSGTLDGKPWSLPQQGGAKPLQLKQSLRLEGVVEFPEHAVVKTAQIRVTDGQGGVKTSQTTKL